MKTSIYANSVYQIGYFGNFIGNTSASNLMRCILACQNNDACRLANYDQNSSVCSLIDEYSFVGQIQAASAGQSVITFQLCLNPAQQEPQYICFGSTRPPVLVQQAIDNAQSVRNLSSMPIYIAKITTNALLYMQEHSSDQMQLYNLQNYQFVQRFSIFPGVNKRNFDLDLAQNFIVFIGHAATPNLYISSSTRNQTVLTSAGTYFGVCLSSRYIVVTRKASGTSIDVFHRANGSLAFQLNVTTGYNGCAVLRNELFIATDSDGLKSMNLLDGAAATIKAWPIGAYRQGWTHIAVDSAGRTYIPCSSCNAFASSCLNSSVCALISESTNNTLLGQVKDYWYISGRASKYVYRYVGTDYSTQHVALFEY